MRIHCATSTEMPNEDMILGSAVLTTVASRTTAKAAQISALKQLRSRNNNAR